MSISDQRTNLRIVTVGDFDPQADQAIEYDFIGRVVAGRYTVLEHIGDGGMADVFRATDEDLGVDVAIKLLKPRMASDELRARMVQEARAAAKVRHANLLRVFGTGKLDGTAYIVMELLRGPNLDQYLREHTEQRLPWNEALALLLPALEALHAIHEQGYIHRDIKAGNILITRDPGRPPIAPVTPSATPTNPTSRRLQIAGGVMVPLGLVALGVVGAVGASYRRDLARADELHTELMTRTCTDDDRTRLRDLLAATRREEGLMIALGVTGGALLTAGTALLVRGTLQRRRARLGFDLRQHRVGLTISGEF